MQQHTLFARFLTFLLGAFLMVGVATAQPYGGGDDPTRPDPMLERLTAILDSLAGGGFTGNPCDLTPEQRQAFDQIARQEFGFEFGWSTINCDSTDILVDPIDPNGQRIAAVLDSLSGGFFNGDPCSLTTEQRRAFDSISQAEFGFNFGWGEIDCSGIGGGGGDPTKDRIMEIIDSVAGGGFTGNPCDLTLEQRQEIDRKLQQELGLEFGWGEIICDSIGIPIDPHGERIATVLDSLSGGFFNGDPCSLTTEQRRAFDSISQAEFGFNFAWGEIDCSGIGGGGGDPTKDRIMEIIDSVAGGGFTGNPCDLTLEQRQEIDRKLQQELGFDFGWSSINCDSIDWGGGWGDTLIVEDPCGGLTPEQLLAICKILEDVAGGNFSGDICDLTLEQRQEIDRRMMEEIGLSFGLADFPCGGIIARDPSTGNAGKTRQTEQAIARMATINRQESIEGVSLHPNPARTTLTVAFNMNRTAQAEVVVVNGLGETVMARNLGTLPNGQHTANVDVSEMGTGAYFVKVQLNGRTIQTTPLRVAR